MNEYIVTRKIDGVEVYRYKENYPIEWNGMEFATHDHRTAPDPEQIPAVSPVGAVYSKLAYLRRFTQIERIAIRSAAAQNMALADYLALLELAEEIDTGDADTVAAVMMLEQLGLISAGRANEVLYG